ncbi:MAG: hypothetical protein JW991_03025 [Candidatus Pacebacteria bacterium]|nr:hypothetical protein [Candidatus Paceibacterota bacterium]
MKKITRFISGFFYLIGLVYLCLPLGEMPALPDSLKSKEPGDTVEIPGVSAYYTNLSRYEVLEFYRQNFSRSRLGNLPLPVVVLNHPPEYTREAIRDTVDSTFLYELVHPGRDSLFINGWDPAEDPKFKKNKNLSQVLKEDNRFWERKVTLRLFSSGTILRLIIFSVAYWLIIGLSKEALKMIFLIFKYLWLKKESIFR